MSVFESGGHFSVTPKMSSLAIVHHRLGTVSSWAHMVSLGERKGVYLAIKNSETSNDHSVIYEVNPGGSPLLRQWAGKADASRRVGNGRVDMTALGFCVSMFRQGDSVYIAGPRIIYVCRLTPEHGMVFLNTLTFSNSGGEKDGSISDDSVSYRDIRQISGHGKTIYINDNNAIRLLKDGEVSTLRKIPEVTNIVALSNEHVTVCSQSILVAIVSDRGGEIVNIAGHLTAKGTIDGDASTSRFTKITGMVADATNCVFLTDVTEEGTAIRKIDTEKQLTTTLQICPEIINGRLVCFTMDGDLMIAEQDGHADNKGKLYVVKTACLIPESLKFASDVPSTSQKDLHDQSKFDETLDGRAYHDITFEFEDGNLYAHKFKLMDYEYFRGMFANPAMTSDIGKDAENKYETSRDVFLELLSFVYTGKMELDTDNVFEILALANSLMINPIKDECQRFIMNGISGDVETLVDCYVSVMKVEKYSCVRELLHSEVCKNYREIEGNDVLVDLLGVENLLAAVVKDSNKRKRV